MIDRKILQEAIMWEGCAVFIVAAMLFVFLFGLVIFALLVFLPGWLLGWAFFGTVGGLVAWRCVWETKAIILRYRKMRALREECGE